MSVEHWPVEIMIRLCPCAALALAPEISSDCKQLSRDVPAENQVRPAPRPIHRWKAERSGFPVIRIMVR